MATANVNNFNNENLHSTTSDGLWAVESYEPRMCLGEIIINGTSRTPVRHHRYSRQYQRHGVNGLRQHSPQPHHYHWARDPTTTAHQRNGSVVHHSHSQHGSNQWRSVNGPRNMHRQQDDDLLSIVLQQTERELAQTLRGPHSASHRLSVLEAIRPAHIPQVTRSLQRYNLETDELIGPIHHQQTEAQVPWPASDSQCLFLWNDVVPPQRRLYIRTPIPRPGSVRHWSRIPRTRSFNPL